MNDNYTGQERKEILNGIIEHETLDVHSLIKLCEILKIPSSLLLTDFINSLLIETLKFNRYLRPEEKARLSRILREREPRRRRDFRLIKS